MDPTMISIAIEQERATLSSMMTSLLESAFEYANYWATSERRFVADFSSSDPNRQLLALQQSGGYFKISRSFPLSYDVEIGLPRLSPVLTTINGISADPVTETNLASVIKSLRLELGRAYGGRDLLSAATKFLWLRYPKVVVIFDSQARLALHTPLGDYDRYLARWLSQYATDETEIVRCCAEVASSAARISPDAAIDQEVRNLAGERWFHRRVYDIYLWKVGRPATTIAA
jgi:hypothetical protein